MVSMEKLALASLRPIYKTDDIELVDERVAMVHKKYGNIALVHLSIVDNFITSNVRREKIMHKLEACMKRLFDEGKIESDDQFFIEVSDLQCIINDEDNKGIIRLERFLHA